MKAARLLLAGCALAASFAVCAQYQWIDQDGRHVFSDRAPPASVPARNIVSQPRAGSVRAAATAPARTDEAASAEPAAAGAASPAAPGVDKTLEARKKEAEAQQAAQEQAEQARQAAARADNCKRAHNAKAALASGQRIARTNDKGEREVLDDAQRAAELQRVEQIIASDCR